MCYLLRCILLIVSKVQHAADFDRRRNGLRRRAYRDICTACRNHRHVVLLQLLIAIQYGSKFILERSVDPRVTSYEYMDARRWNNAGTIIVGTLKVGALGDHFIFLAIWKSFESLTR